MSGNKSNRKRNRRGRGQAQGVTPPLNPAQLELDEEDISTAPLPRVITAEETAASARPKVRAGAQLTYEGGPSGSRQRDASPEGINFPYRPTPPSPEYTRFLTADELATSGLPLDMRGTASRLRDRLDDSGMDWGTGGSNEAEDIGGLWRPRANIRWHPSQGADATANEWGRAAAEAHRKSATRVRSQTLPRDTRQEKMSLDIYRPRGGDRYGYNLKGALRKNMSARIEHSDRQTLHPIQDPERYRRPQSQMHRPRDNTDWMLGYAGSRAHRSLSDEVVRRQSASLPSDQSSPVRAPPTRAQLAEVFGEWMGAMSPEDRKSFIGFKTLQTELTPEERRVDRRPTAYNVLQSDRRLVDELGAQQKQRSRNAMTRDGRRSAVRQRLPENLQTIYEDNESLPQLPQYTRFLTLDELAASNVPLDMRVSGRRWRGGPVDQLGMEPMPEDMPEDVPEDMPWLPTEAEANTEWHPIQGRDATAQEWGFAAANAHRRRFHEEMARTRPSVDRKGELMAQGIHRSDTAKDRYEDPDPEVPKRERLPRIAHSGPQELQELQESDRYKRRVEQMGDPLEDKRLNALKQMGRRSYPSFSRHALRRSSSMPNLSELPSAESTVTPPPTRAELALAFNERYKALGKEERELLLKFKKAERYGYKAETLVRRPSNKELYSRVVPSPTIAHIRQFDGRLLKKLESNRKEIERNAMTRDARRLERKKFPKDMTAIAETDEEDEDEEEEEE